MNSAGLAAYQRNQNTTQNPRDVEYRLLGQVTAALMRAKDDPSDYQARTKAILWNRDVWAAFRVDLLDEQNNLPKQIRANLISISFFIEKETYAVLDKTSDIDDLIDINKTIMEGLRPAAQQQQPLPNETASAPPSPASAFSSNS